ncbi:MAG TPA: glutathione transferase GstA [Burkholderiales bacterium]|nr:glutathione transferase GstA [Burkholderiales bacterium]
MKLYYSPGACSLAPHIAMREAGIPVDLKKVDLKAKQYEGGDYKQVNGKGYVPAVETPEGVLTEAPVILQYIADQKPESGLAPKPGDAARYKMQEMLNFITSEMHKGMGNFFNPALNDGWRQAVTDRLGVRLDWLAKQLEGKQYLMGDKFTVADAYLFTILNWAGPSKFDLSKWPAVVEYQKRVAARPKVQEALKAEGLVK